MLPLMLVISPPDALMLLLRAIIAAAMAP